MPEYIEKIVSIALCGTQIIGDILTSYMIEYTTFRY